MKTDPIWIASNLDRLAKAAHEGAELARKLDANPKAKAYLDKLDAKVALISATCSVIDELISRAYEETEQ